MMDFKFHVISLTAVFMALAVGILIGVNIARHHAVQGLTSQAMARLSEEFKRVTAEDQEVRAENAQLKESLGLREQFEEQLIPTVVAGRLQDKRIALILAGEHPDPSYLHGLIRAIEAAGGQVVNTTVIKDRLLPQDDARRQELLMRFGVMSQDAKAAAAELHHALGRAIGLAEAPQGIQRAANLTPGLALDGDYSTRVDAAVVLSCATRDRTALVESGNSVEAGVIAGLREGGVRVVACETEGPYSITSYLHRSGVTTVDCVDTAPGQVAMVLALEGARGSFGLKQGAASVIPPLERNAQ